MDVKGVNKRKRDVEGVVALEVVAKVRVFQAGGLRAGGQSADRRMEVSGPTFLSMSAWMNWSSGGFRTAWSLYMYCMIICGTHSERNTFMRRNSEEMGRSGCGHDVDQL